MVNDYQRFGTRGNEVEGVTTAGIRRKRFLDDESVYTHQWAFTGEPFSKGIVRAQFPDRGS
jgi:hypothetical protein